MAQEDHTGTYRPTEKWLKLTEKERLALLRDLLKEDPANEGISVEEVPDNGHVVLRIEHSIAAGERGMFLLNLEQKFKNMIDIGLTLWLEPVGDKSKLRQLRGVEVKS